jgi:hypothetical protein
MTSETYTGVPDQRHARARLSRRGKDFGTYCPGGGAGEPQELDWTQRLEEISFLCRESNPGRPDVQSIVRPYTD